MSSSIYINLEENCPLKFSSSCHFLAIEMEGEKKNIFKKWYISYKKRYSMVINKI